MILRTICANEIRNHSSEGYFIFTVTLLMKWTLAGRKGGRWGAMTIV